MATLAAAQQQQQQQVSAGSTQSQQQASVTGSSVVLNSSGPLNSTINCSTSPSGNNCSINSGNSNVNSLVSSRRLSFNGHCSDDIMNSDPCIKDNHRNIHCNSLSSSPNNHRDTTGQFVRTRIRTSFDPELELPKLHKWFNENQHPSRSQIHLYVKELNSLESRRGRKPLDVNNVVYWFKNARAAHKRQELKFINGSPLIKDHSLSNNCVTSKIDSNSSSCNNNITGNNHSTSSGTNFTVNDSIGNNGTSNSNNIINNCSSNVHFNNKRDNRLSMSRRLRVSSRLNHVDDVDDDEDGESVHDDDDDDVDEEEEEDLATGTDDNSSQLSHTLDLSMRAIKKESGLTVNSPDLATSCNSDSHCGSDTAIKEEDEEMASEEDEDAAGGESDRDSYEKYYQASSVTAAAAAAAVATAGHMAAATFYSNAAAAAAAAVTSNNNHNHHPHSHSHHHNNSISSGNNSTVNGLPIIPLTINGSCAGANSTVGANVNSTTVTASSSSSSPSCNNNNNSNLFNLTSCNVSNLTDTLDTDSRRSIRRSRTFIDPMSEVPRLEQWFTLNTHPTHSQIVKYTDELNQLHYRQKFPKLEAKNIQFWFKNRRAKYKRLNIPSSSCNVVTNSSSSSSSTTVQSSSNAILTSMSNGNFNINCINNAPLSSSSASSSSPCAVSFTPPNTLSTSTTCTTTCSIVTDSSSLPVTCKVTSSSPSNATSSSTTIVSSCSTSPSHTSSSSPVVTSALNIERLISH